jgi:hypothetical protein
MNSFVGGPPRSEAKKTKKSPAALRGAPLLKIDLLPNSLLYSHLRAQILRSALHHRVLERGLRQQLLELGVLRQAGEGVHSQQV